MKKHLNMATPSIRCYQHYAFPSGIVNGNIRDKEYIYNLFIRLVYRKKDDTDIELDKPYFFAHIPTLFIEEGLIIPSVIKYPFNSNDRTSVIDFVRQCIDKEAYVSGMWNEYFIPRKDAYLKYNYERNYLIYGYDDEEKCFISAGYLGKNFWSDKFKISYDAFVESLMIKHETIIFFTYTYNKAFNSSLDLKKIEKEISDYVNSNSLIKSNKDYSYGISANYDYFKNFQSKIKMKGELILPPLYALLEHKSFMFERLHYLKRLGAIRIEQDELDAYEAVMKTHHAILNMGLKYKLTGNEEVLKNISKIGMEVTDREYYILKSIYPTIS